MKLSELDSSFHQILSHSPALKIAAEFYVNKFRFLIISGNFSSDQLETSTLVLNNLGIAKILGQFQFKGETYAIATEQELINDAELDLVQVLTARELQIATFVARGKSNKQIAKQLKISKWTVSTHLRRIFMKLQVDNRAAMVYKCFGAAVSPILNLQNNSVTKFD